MHCGNDDFLLNCVWRDLYDLLWRLIDGMNNLGNGVDFVVVSAQSKLYDYVLLNTKKIKNCSVLRY